MKLEAGQVAVVTGAAGGIGYGICEALCERGLRVVLADVEEGALASAVDRLKSIGAEVVGVQTDVSKRDAVEHLASATIEAFGRVDVLCNNAGVTVDPIAIWDSAESDLHWLHAVNFWGVYYGIKAFVPLMIAQGSGHVVNTVSGAAFDPIPFRSLYATSKCAVVAMTECLHDELERDGTGVHATLLYPGRARTGITAAGRNRPAELGSGGTAWRRSEVVVGGYYVDPRDVGSFTVSAIELDLLYAGTQPSHIESVQKRTERMLADLRRGPAPIPRHTYVV